MPRTIFRPSIVLGDSRRPETNQFDMVRAFVFLAGLPALPFRPTDRIDIVPVDYVADAVATLHQKEKPAHEIYHLSSGHATRRRSSQLTDALAKAQGKRGPMFVPSLEGAVFEDDECAGGRAGKIGGLATLLKVFLPYLVWNTVFDNTRVVAEMGRQPAPFSQYCYPLLRFSRENHFVYKYREWPSAVGKCGAARAAAQSRYERDRSSCIRGSAAMMDLLLEAWVSGLIELNKFEWMLGAGEAWKPGDKAEAAFRRIQRHAQHRLRRSRGRNDAAGAADSGRRRIWRSA